MKTLTLSPQILRILGDAQLSFRKKAYELENCPEYALHDAVGEAVRFGAEDAHQSSDVLLGIIDRSKT